jgi:hypothetical protein
MAEDDRREDLLLVFTNAAEGREDEYHDWYEQTHIPDVLAVPGVVSAQRYTVAPLETPEVEGAPVPEPSAHGYLVAYTLDRDGNEVMEEFVARIGSGKMQLSDVMDFATVAMSVWRPLGPRRAAGA